MNFIYKIKNHLKVINIVEKLIYTIIAVFIIDKLVDTFAYIKTKNTLSFILENFKLSSTTDDVFTKFYTFITYSFLHIGFLHLIFNLIVLYYIGNLFLDYFNSKKLLIYFFLGSLFGGLFFIFSYNFFAIFKTEIAYLFGASASITAIMVGIATHIPNYEMNFKFIGAVKLWLLTLIWLLLSFILIPNGNAGGQFAHLGGALIGFVLTKYVFNKNKIYDFAFNKKNKTNLKTVYKKTDYGLSSYQKESLRQRKIDFLLDKISKSGYEVLTNDEKEYLDSFNKN